MANELQQEILRLVQEIAEDEKVIVKYMREAAYTLSELNRNRYLTEAAIAKDAMSRKMAVIDLAKECLV